MVNLAMEDWEDWGLAIGISGTLVLCFIFNMCRIYRQEQTRDFLLDDPV